MTVHFSHEDIYIRTLASGARLSVPLFRFTGRPGKKVYIQANIHGPEIAGIGAIYDLIPMLREQPTINGTITVVPSINPVGLDSKINGQQVGYMDLNDPTVKNFNRIYQMLVEDKPDEDAEPNEPQKLNLETFAAAHLDADMPTIIVDFRGGLRGALDDIRAKAGKRGLGFATRLALIIQQLSFDADYLIDLHTAGNAIYHMYTFEECLASVPYFDIHHTIQLDNTFSGVLDEAFLQPYLRLRKAFADAGRDIPFSAFDKEAFTPELGSADTLYRDAMHTDAERIINYLRYKGVLEGEAQRGAGEFYTGKGRDYHHYSAPTGGLLLWGKSPGDEVMAGETLATILRTYALPDGETEIAVTAEAGGVLINRDESQVVHEGMPLCSVLTNMREISNEV